VVRSATNHVSIATNGKTDGGINHGVQPSLDEYTMTMLASMPLAHRPDARDVAVIGYGTGMSTTVLLGSPRVQRVDTIEIEPDMPRGAQAFRFFTEPAYSDPRSRVIIDDAKSYFARSTRRYDVILSEPSNPWVSGVASLFTREFYARVSGKLNDGGILVQWLHTYSFSDALLASIIKAMRESVPAFVIYAANSGDLVVVASPSGKVPPLDPAVMHLGRIPEYLGRIEVRRIEDLEIRRVADQDSVKALFSTIDVAPNSDYFPIVDSGAARARFMNEIAFGIHDVGNAPWPILEMTARSPLAPEAPLSVPKWYSDRRTETAVRAQVAFGFLTGAAIPDAEAREQLGDSYRAFATFRDRFIACGSDFPATDLWDVLEVVATHESVFLPPAESAQLWERVRRSSCYAKLPDRVRGWFAVFDALGRRDAAESARTALAALEGAKGEAQQSYFYGAAMTGLIAAGRMDEARKTYDRHHAALPETVKLRGWFRWIEGRVLGAAKPGAAAAGAARVAGVH
jgi:spermidine synthase